MGISYLSKPLESTIKPFQENIGLIAQVAAQKQNKYDQLVTALFQKENQLLSLDMINEERNSRKNKILNEIDDNLNSMASLDLLNPENIRKIDGIFDPILQDNVLMREVAQTKTIRQNQELYEKAQKKNPSLGNQQNYNVSQDFVSMYAKAKGDDNIDEVAKYTTLFAPYVDVKMKDAKAFHDLGLGKGADLEIKIGVGGVKYTKTTEGWLTDAQILGKVNALRTPEDDYQLMLDGWSTYGNTELNQMMGSLQTKIGTTSKNVDDGLKDVDTKLKIYDKNGDGQFDNPNDPLQADNFREFVALTDEKSYLKQLQAANGEYSKYLTKYNTSKDLAVSERLQLFQKLKSDDLSMDLVTLFSRPEGTKNIFSYDDTDLFKENKATERALIKAAAKAKVKAEKAPVQYKHIDVNNNGLKDAPTEDIYVTSDYTTEYANVTEEELKKMKNPFVIGDYNILLSNGETISGNLNKEGISINSWHKVFDKEYEEAADRSHEYINNELQSMSTDLNGVNDKKLTEVKARFEQYDKQYKDAKGDSKKIEELNKTYKDEGNKFQMLSIYNESVSQIGTVYDIKKSIDNHLLTDKGYDKAFINANKNVFTFGNLLSEDEFTKFTKAKPGANKSGNLENSKAVYEKIKYLPFVKGDSEQTILTKISSVLTKEELKTLPYMPNEPGTAELDNTVLIDPLKEATKIVKDNLDNGLKRLTESYYTEKEDIYKSLLDANAALIINMPIPELKDQKEDLFHRKVLGVFSNRLSDPTNLKLDTKTNKYVKLTDDEKKALSTKVGGIELKQYNTSTGTVTGKVDGIGMIKIQLTSDDANNGLPFGIPKGDLLSKNLLLDSILKQRSGKPGISKSIEVSKTSIGDYMVLYNPMYARDGGFMAYKKTDPSTPVVFGNSVNQVRGQIKQSLIDTQISAYSSTADYFDYLLGGVNTGSEDESEDENEDD